MARTVQSKRHQQLAELVSSRYHASAHAKTPRESEYEKARKRYEPSYIDKQKVKRAPYVKANYLFRTTRTKIQHLLAATEANGRYVVAHSTTADGGAVGEVVTLALNKQFRWKGSSMAEGNEVALRQLAHTGLLYGNGALHLRWHEDEDDWGVRFTNISPYDLFPDWKSGRWFIVRRYVPLWKIGEIAESLSAPSGEVIGIDQETGEEILDNEPRDGGVAIKAFRRVLKEVKAGKRAQDENSNSYSESGNENQITVNRVADDHSDATPDFDPLNARILVLEYYETGKRGRIAKIIPGFGEDSADLVLQAERNPYGVCPIVPFIPYPVDNEFYGHGLSEIAGGACEVLDYALRSQVRLIGKNADATLLVRRNLRLPPQLLKNPAGKVIPVDSFADTPMSYLAPGTDSGLYSFMYQFQQKVADGATGESEARRGNVGGADSATEAAIAEAGGQSDDQGVFREWRNTIEYTARVMLEMNKLHITREKAIPYVGRDADRLVALRPEFLQGTFEVTFGGSLRGTSPKQQVAEWLNFAQSFGASGAVDIAAIARDVAFQMGVPNPDDWMMNKTGRPKMSANTENQALFSFGQELEVHPEDNDMQHIVTHVKALQRAAAEQPGHPALFEMQAHIQQHQVAMQAKQMPTPDQGMMGQGGQQSFTPGAGNPQVLNARTQEGVDARQTSNQQSPGMSPGGVAPGRQVGEIVHRSDFG